MEDASLEDFLDAGGDDGESGNTDQGGDTDGDVAIDTGADIDTGTEADDVTDTKADVNTNTDANVDGDGDVEPATATFEWSPDGADCEVCGGEVRRRWNSESGLVCRGCKEW